MLLVDDCLRYDPALQDGGKILSFDLPAFEFYSTQWGGPVPKRAQEGRLKHLSSRHLLRASGGPGECRLRFAEYFLTLNRHIGCLYKSPSIGVSHSWHEGEEHVHLL